MKIFLDDDPRRDSWVDDTWTITRTWDDVMWLLAQHAGEVEVLSLDHDIGDFTRNGGEEWKGYHVLTFLEGMAAAGDFSRLPKRFEIHSANSVGRKNMQAAIDSIERMRNT